MYKKINGFGRRIQGVLNSALLPRTKFQRSGKDSANLGRVLEGTWAVQKGSWGSLGRHLGASWDVQEWSWRPLGGLLEASWRPLGVLKKAWSAKGRLPGACGALLDASWGALGAEKSSLERLLAAPRGIPRQVSAILGAKRLPKGRPRGSKIEPKRRLELNTRFLQQLLFFCSTELH